MKIKVSKSRGVLQEIDEVDYNDYNHKTDHSI